MGQGWEFRAILCQLLQLQFKIDERVVKQTKQNQSFVLGLPKLQPEIQQVYKYSAAAYQNIRKP
jgi:hypothetical protein